MKELKLIERRILGACPCLSRSKRLAKAVDKVFWTSAFVALTVMLLPAILLAISFDMCLRIWYAVAGRPRDDLVYLALSGECEQAQQINRFFRSQVRKRRIYLMVFVSLACLIMFLWVIS